MSGASSRQRSGAPLGRKVIRDQRVGWGHAACFADADAEAVKKQLPVTRRGAAQCRERAPHRKRCRDDTASAGAVREIGQRNTQKRIKHRKGQSSNCAELRVSEVEVSLDRRPEDAEDLPVEKIEDIGQ